MSGYNANQILGILDTHVFDRDSGPPEVQNLLEYGLS
jgi:hypothetical protein